MTFELDVGPPDLVKRLRAAGARVWVEVVVRFPTCSGEQRFDIDTAQRLELFLTDRRAFEAHCWRISPAALDDWKRSGFAPRCGGVTRQGRPCRAMVGGLSDPPEFFRHHRQVFCHHHGGDR
jgi:hypothetical protein